MQSLHKSGPDIAQVTSPENDIAQLLSRTPKSDLVSVANVFLEKCDRLKLIRDYEYALDNSCIVSITNETGKITYANDSFCKISKYSREELIGQDHGIINSGYHDASYIRELWFTIINGNIWRGEFRNKAKDGSFYWVDTTIIPFMDDKNKPYQYLSIRIDITKQKKVEEALLQSQMRFKQAQQIAQMGNWEINFRTGKSKWSEETYRIYGIEPGDHNFTVSQWMSFIYPDDFSAVKKIVDNAASTYSAAGFYHRIVRPDGTVRDIYSQSKYEFENGVPVGLYGICRDVTESQKAVKKQRELEKKLFEQQHQQQLKLTAAVFHAQEKERNKLGAELHDNVNQILAGVKMILGMVEKYPAKAKELVASCIGNIQQAIEENRKITHELVTPNLESDSLTDQISSLCQTMLKPAGIRLTFSHKCFKEEVLTAEQKIAVYRILQEQCTNIIKYAKASNVEISFIVNNNTFRMDVKDNGIGMPSNKTEKGIGLRNIHSRISVLGGNVHIETAPGKGFSLHVTFPIQQENT